MKRVFAVRIASPAEALEVRELEAPSPGPGEVSVRIHAAPINPADLLLLAGRHLARPPLPAAVGIEGAGEICALGPGVTAWRVGQRVALPFGGTWSEEVVTAERVPIAIPDHLSMEQAAMLSVNPVTAGLLLEGLGPGDTVLQNAAGSAVGTLVIRLAAARGIRTINVVRRQEQVEPLRALGADVVLVGDEDLAARIQLAARGVRVTRGLDAVAGEATGRLAAGVADEETVICYGLLAADQVVVPARDVVFRGLVLRGLSRLRELGKLTPAARHALLSDLAEQVASGALASTVEATYPLDQATAAVAHAERPGRQGKILLRP